MTCEPVVQAWVEPAAQREYKRLFKALDKHIWVRPYTPVKCSPAFFSVFVEYPGCFLHAWHATQYQHVAVAFSITSFDYALLGRFRHLGRVLGIKKNIYGT